MTSNMFVSFTWPDGVATVHPRQSLVMDPIAVVDSGVRLLNERRPGWEHQITQEIDLTSTKACVLGQVYGDFFDAVNELWPGMDHTARTMQIVGNGFDAPLGIGLWEIKAEWERRIKALRMGNIGEEQEEVEFEPLTAPSVPEPVPAEVPAEQPVPVPV